MIKVLALASALLASASMGVASTNLLVNGGFENTSPGGVTATTTPQTFGNWQVATTSGSTNFYIFNAPGLNEAQPADGTKLLSIGGFNTTKGVGLLWQDFATTAGQTYQVSFFFGRTNNTSDEVNVSVDATAFNLVSGETTDTLGQISSGNAPATGTTGTLNQVGFQFTATGTSSRLLFADTTVAGGPSLQLDAVSVSAIPEPSSFAALAGIGALGLAGLRRRRSAR